MNKIYIFILISFFSLIFSKKYSSEYYNNVSNILNKFPKVDIDYIFSKQSSENNKENPTSNPFRNIFYDYYQSSVPLYDEKMNCYFPLKKNISLKLDHDYDSIPKTKNISKFLGKYFLKSLKGKCEQFYIERWYYSLCPLLGAMQTLSYIQSKENEKQEKQEVNYLGYELDEEYNNTIFLQNLDEETKKYFEKKYSNELIDIYEENLFDNNAENSKIIGIYKNFIKFYGNKVFDSSKYPNKDKIFKLEYKRFSSNEIVTFSADILKVISDNMILINKTLGLNELRQVKKINKIKILKQENINIFYSFFNQSFFIYDEYVYSSKINLLACASENCFLTISNQSDEKAYKIETIIEPKFAILKSGINKNIKLYEKERYCIFLDDDRLYFYGKGDIEELTETEEPGILILFGRNLNIENSDEIILLLNDTLNQYDNVVFINAVLDKIIRLKFLAKINETHFKVEMINKKDTIFFEKQISLDEKYIIVKYNRKNKNESTKKLNHTYYILGNENNISLTNKSLYSEKKESIIINSNLKTNNEITKEKENENNYYSITNNQEFIITLELSSYNENYRESYTYFCLSKSKICNKDDYEILFDLKNNGIVINQINDFNNASKAFTINKNNIREKIYKYGIVYMNSSLYINNYFGKGITKGNSEIILKYKINDEKYDINYLIINQDKSKNILIDDIKFYNNVDFDIFKNIYIYNQKYLLDDNTIYVDTFEKGDYCNPIKANRKVIINYICDEEGIYDLKLMNVYEDKKNICIYNYYAKSRFLCNPNTMMKNYEKFSPVKTLCYLDN